MAEPAIRAPRFPLRGSWLAVGLLLACTPPSTTREDTDPPALAEASSEPAPKAEATRRSTADASAEPAPSPWPLCGVLTEGGYHPEDGLAFLVPVASDDAAVQRYEAVDATGQAAPLSVYAGWWLCITKGTLRRAPTEGEAGPEYGLVEIEDFEIDQSTGERGQE